MSMSLLTLLPDDPCSGAIRLSQLDISFPSSIRTCPVALGCLFGQCTVNQFELSGHGLVVKPGNVRFYPSAMLSRILSVIRLTSSEEISTLYISCIDSAISRMLMPLLYRAMICTSCEIIR